VVEVGEEQGVQLACEVALEAAHDLLGAFALRGAPLGVGAGGGVDAQAGSGTRFAPERWTRTLISTDHMLWTWSSAMARASPGPSLYRWRLWIDHDRACVGARR
jgi:hypothetical protein